MDGEYDDDEGEDLEEGLSRGVVSESWECVYGNEDDCLRIDDFRISGSLSLMRIMFK